MARGSVGTDARACTPADRRLVRWLGVDVRIGCQQVLTIARLRPDGAARTYYERAVASSREDYYAGGGEAAGEWVGSGAGELGLAGEVLDGQLSDLLAGRSPVDGDVLRVLPCERVMPWRRLDPERNCAASMRPCVTGRKQKTTEEGRDTRQS